MYSLLALTFILLRSINAGACFIHLRCMEGWMFISLQASTKHMPSCWWIKCVTVRMMFIFCCTVNLLLLITTGMGAGLFGGNPSSFLSLLLLLSEELMIVVNVDDKLKSCVPRCHCLCYKLRTSQERNPGFVHRKKVIFR